MQNVQVDIDYVPENNQLETLTLTLGLQYTVDNATSSETNENVKTNVSIRLHTK